MNSGFNKLSFGLLIWMIFSLFSCQESDRIITPAFYHWQTTFSINDLENSYLDSLNIQKIYVKFFDVDWDKERKEAIPNAEIVWQPDEWQKIEIIPTVFITNRTLTNLSTGEIPKLAQQITQKIEKLAVSHFYDELQIDCDWTQSTKEKYFQLLAAIKSQQANKLLSATIRLHQVKFFEETGVPPVDRGMLMYYNIGEIGEWESDNSIFETEIATQYIQRLKKYPLELDVVLPLFHWGLIYRDGELFKIINKLEAQELEQYEQFEKTEENRYEVIKATYLTGHYLYEGDKIRTEKITENDLQIATQQLIHHLPKQNRTIGFYHLEEEILIKWQINMLRKTIASFE